MKEIVIASHNEGKVREIRSLLKPMGFKIYSVKKFCINEPVENGKTFRENMHLFNQKLFDTVSSEYIYERKRADSVSSIVRHLGR